MKQKKKKIKKYKHKKETFFSDWVLIIPLLVLIWMEVAAYFMISLDEKREYIRRKTSTPSYSELRREYYKKSETFSAPTPSSSPTPEVPPEDYGGSPSLQ